MSDRILFLGPASSRLIPYLADYGETVHTHKPITPKRLDFLRPSWVISHGYRHILKDDVLERVEGRAINLHVSMLPWNRGADPNLWSILDNTPKGVSIHYIDAGVDTGDLIAQRRVPVYPMDTLASSYRRLQIEIMDLFGQFWPQIHAGRAPRYPQQSGGSFHRVRDREHVEHLLTDGWNTPVHKLRTERMTV